MTAFALAGSVNRQYLILSIEILIHLSAQEKGSSGGTKKAFVGVLLLAAASVVGLAVKGESRADDLLHHEYRVECRHIVSALCSHWFDLPIVTKLPCCRCPNTLSFDGPRGLVNYTFVAISVGGIVTGCADTVGNA